MKELGLPSSLSRTDFLGLLLPGALLVIALSVIFPDMLRGHFAAPKDSSWESISGVVYFVVISFVLGCLIHAAGFAFDEVLLGKHGFPTHWVRSDHVARKPLSDWHDWVARLRQDHTYPYLYESQIVKFRRLIKEHFDIDLPITDQGYSSPWTGIVVQIRVALARRKLDTRLQEHIHSFYLYRSMLFTLACIALLIVLKIVVEVLTGDSRDWNWVGFVLAALALIIDLSLMYCALRSAFEFARSYARELFTVYLEIYREPKIDGA